MSGFVAGQIYRDSDRPRYTKGHTICAVLCFCGFINALLLKITFKMVNKRTESLTITSSPNTKPERGEGINGSDFRYL